MDERTLKVTPAGQIPLRLYHDWGPWQLDRATRELYTEAGGYRYAIDLDSCTTSAEVLDWICQINGKTWCDDDPAAHDRLVAGLVNALVDILQPQANLCSFGTSRRLSKRKIAARIQSIKLEHKGKPCGMCFGRHGGCTDCDDLGTRPPVEDF